MMEKNHFGAFSMQKKETTAAKKKTTKKCETTINSQFLNANHTRNLNTLETVNSWMQNTLESKTDVSNSVYLSNQINGTLQTGRDR